MKSRALIALIALSILSGCSGYSPQQTTTIPRQLYVAPIEQKAVTNQQVDTYQLDKIQVEEKQGATVPLSNDNYYTNVDGNEVHSPAFAPSIPAGASARCRDGSYSFSLNRRGTCSHHGGVEEWY